MTHIDVEVYVGLERALWRSAVVVPAWLIEVAQETMSEFEVLEMGLHDDHYAAGSMRALASASLGSPLPAFLQSPTIKSSAPNVTGNIGEGLGLAAFATLAGVDPTQVTRVRRQKNRLPYVERRTPDFIASLRMAGAAPARIDELLQAGGPIGLKGHASLAAFPDRFPIEAKASMRSANGSIWSALWQLVEYWHSANMLTPGALDVGFGIVVCISDVGAATRTVRIHVLAPRSHVDFCAALNPLSATRATRESFYRQFSRLSGGPFVEWQDVI